MCNTLEYENIIGGSIVPSLRNVFVTLNAPFLGGLLGLGAQFLKVERDDCLKLVSLWSNMTATKMWIL